jgi:hypothetical protein
VIVKVFPETVAGPERTLKLTPNPALEDAKRVIGGTPYVTGDGGANQVIASGACVMVNAVPVLVGLLLLSPLYEAVTEYVPGICPARPDSETELPESGTVVQRTPLT